MLSAGCTVLLHNFALLNICATSIENCDCECKLSCNHLGNDSFVSYAQKLRVNERVA
jgi:hypothetical protein